MKLSAFGRKFTADAGITSLMDDLGNAMASGDDLIMMGGGNPGHIPEVHQRVREILADIGGSDEGLRRLVGIYDPPQGEKQFIAALAAMLNREYGWGLTPDNIALTNGSQAAFFMLFNMFGGDYGNGQRKHILLPLAPEYIGYADTGDRAGPVPGGAARDFLHRRPRVQVPGGLRCGRGDRRDRCHLRVPADQSNR